MGSQNSPNPNQDVILNSLQPMEARHQPKNIRTAMPKGELRTEAASRRNWRSLPSAATAARARAALTPTKVGLERWAITMPTGVMARTSADARHNP